MYQSVFCCYYEVFLWILHLWAILNENQPGASLALLRNFYDQKSKWPPSTNNDFYFGNISTFKTLRDMFLVSNTRFSGPRNPFLVQLKLYTKQNFKIFKITLIYLVTMGLKPLKCFKSAHIINIISFIK